MKLKNILLAFICFSLLACTKYLDVKPDQRLSVPGKLADLQALMENYTVLNNATMGVSESSADNYYLTYTDWASVTDDNFKRLYTWEKDNVIPQANSLNEWYYTYQGIYYANTVLENIGKIKPIAADTAQWKNVLGQALFYRGRYFLHALSVWALAYDEKTATKDMGIPLRLNSNFNEQNIRASLEQSYQQVIKDLKEAAINLPVITSTPVRPNKAAAYGFLARMYLNMRKYNEAGLYADSCLQLYNKLLDFNTLNASASYPISQFNQEVIFEFGAGAPSLVNNSKAKIDTILYKLYESNDLRKTINFKKNNDGSYGYFGSYENNVNLFAGIATDEMYIIRAESSARAGNTSGAVTDLNTLLLKRYKTGTYINYTETDAAKVLEKVLAERRKELVMRDLRWMDIKRLNKEGYNIKQTRILNGITYELPPNDLRYALAIPEDVIALSGIQPNPR